jgi:hypothetical protein
MNDQLVLHLNFQIEDADIRKARASTTLLNPGETTCGNRSTTKGSHGMTGKKDVLPGGKKI